MRINWKSKNPYLNFVREISKVLSSRESFNQKTKNINFILSKDYSGLWLYSHPSHKFLGNGLPNSSDTVENNPYKKLLSEVKDIMLSETPDLVSLEKSISWFKNNNIRVEDWAVTG